MCIFLPQRTRPIVKIVKISHYFHVYMPGPFVTPKFVLRIYEYTEAMIEVSDSSPWGKEIIDLGEDTVRGRRGPRLPHTVSSPKFTLRRL